MDFSSGLAEDAGVTQSAFEAFNLSTANTSASGDSFSSNPPAANTGSLGDGLTIFNSFANTLTSLAKSANDFQLARDAQSFSKLQSSVNSEIARTQLTTSASLEKLKAQATLAKAQAAVNGNQGNGLLIILAIVGIGIAFMQYAK